MVNFLWTSVSIILVSLTISLRCENEYEALHFTNSTPRSAIDVILDKKFGFPTLMVPTATACSARNDKEDKFNEKISLSKNSLFVRKTYKVNQTSEDVDHYICENPSKLSVLYHTREVDFVFGFEIHYDKSEYKDDGFVESNRGDYDIITNTHAYTNYIKALANYLPSVPLLNLIPSIPAVSRLLQTQLYLDDEPKREMGFLWLDSFRMKFDFKARRVSYVMYGLGVTTRGRRECADYDLGKEFFNSFEMKNLYLGENQKKMLAGVKFPKSESDDNYKEMACESENQCFAKWSLVPAELFHQLVTEPTSCSDLVTVPVWKSTIYDVLTKLDNFLFALSMVIGHPVGDLQIRTGVKGVLQLPADSFIRRTKPITLAGNSIKAPDVIYKFITYTTKGCLKREKTIDKKDEPKSTESELVDSDEKNDELKAEKNEPVGKKEELKDSESKPDNNKGTPEKLETTECRLATAAIIVVIHNNPNFNPEKDKLCEDVCKTLGWEIIKESKLSGEIIESKYIYCCSATEDNIRNIVNIEYDPFVDPRVHYTSPKFSLKAVPMYDMDTIQFQYHDAKEAVVNVYEHLFEGTKFESVDEDKWGTFMVNYHLKKSYFQIEAPKNEGIDLDDAGNEPAGEDKTDESSSSEEGELNGEKKL